MKKIIISILTVLIITISGLGIFATDAMHSETANKVETVENSGELNSSETKEDIKLNDASEEVIGAVTKKDKKIAELSDKYNDKTLGVVAYYLDLVSYYSTPIFFIFLTIGAFNFFIIGNKKLDKKEQGFGWITACIIGWVFFKCIPLIFALFAV